MVDSGLKLVVGSTNILRTFVLIVASDILKLSTWLVWFGTGWAQITNYTTAAVVLSVYLGMKSG